VLTLGSLFDGIGGFPLAALRVGIKPVWASEIEEVPMSITKRHFPEMRHLGDITKICGREIEPVDIVTFGSPCQDLSVAGKRAGLGGGRSGLFLEAVRIIKEMREATCGAYPTFAIWENVPGAFTTNKGEDFRAVAEEIARIAQPRISVIRPKKWPNAGAVVGNGQSLAWRVLDAQYWGVPSVAGASFLSRILLATVPARYFLSPKACAGILRRAAGRGKVLPLTLRLALEERAGVKTLTA